MKWLSHLNITITVNVNQCLSYFICYWFYVVSSVQVERDNVLCGSKAPWTLLNSEAHLGVWRTWLKSNELPAFLELNSLKKQEIPVSRLCKVTTHKWEIHKMATRSTDGIQCWNDIDWQTWPRHRSRGLWRHALLLDLYVAVFFPDAATLKVSPHNFN